MFRATINVHRGRNKKRWLSSLQHHRVQLCVMTLCCFAEYVVYLSFISHSGSESDSSSLIQRELLVITFSRERDPEFLQPATVSGRRHTVLTFSLCHLADVKRIRNIDLKKQNLALIHRSKPLLKS